MPDDGPLPGQLTFAEYADGLPPVIQTDGETYEPDRDGERLQGQRKAVFGLMADSRWRTLAEIEHATGHPEASISARLRDFRKAKYGGNQVNRRYRGEGLWEYQVIPSREAWTR